MSDHHAKAAILSIGDELTLGQTLDTNSRWIAGRLMDLGILPMEHVTVPDDRVAHTAALRRLAASADVVISTGGLGPTSDDLTRQALADATNDELVEDPIALAEIEAWFAGRGRAMTTINRVQALRPTRARSLPNPNGTAPGLFSQLRRTASQSSIPHDCDVFCLPGPPREMIPMFESQVAPRLKPPPGRTVRTRVLHCVGIGESDLALRLGPLMDRGRMPLVGTTASGGIVSIRIRYEGPLSPPEADAIVRATEERSREVAAPYVFGEESQTLPERVVASLRSRSQSLVAVESCTGGMLGEAVTSVSGSSIAFMGGWVTYSNAMKSALVGVPEKTFAPSGPGAVSRECVQAMAIGGLRRSSADWCLAITGIAGPDGGSLVKPVGTVYIALAGKSLATPDVRLFQMGGDRATIREWSVKSALAMLWMHLAATPRVRLLRQCDEPQS